ncbi:odorant receptor 9a-like [Leptopilina heterotoma]|uniref:odorant receptor 9a-like n=1 Tax=Leptopilina heterotoma TaxID=63436 RepID=UPI001CA9F8C2|nr:odorant receptor 9a-like [Leptopilina heterotoma]
MNASGLTVLLFPPPKANEFPLPFKMWTPYDINYKPFFIFSYLHQGVSATLSACVTSSVETLALVIILQVSAQYEILIYRINFLSKSLTINFQKYSTQNYEGKIIKDVIKLHLHIFSIVENLNKLFGSMIFVQFFSSMISLCSATFQLTKVSSNDPKYWALMFLITSTLMQVFLYSYFGEQIKLKSVEFLAGIYEIQWLSTTNATKKNLIMVMIRASKPMTFMGSKIIIMSIDTFVQIVKSAYSAYNLMKSF